MAIRVLRRAYSDSAKAAKARQLLSNAFERIEKDKAFKKTPAALAEMVGNARELGVAPELVQQVFDSVRPGSGATIPPNEQKRLVHEANVQMFGPPRREGNLQPNREFEFDDLPAMGHLQLIEHRDQRHYVRTAAYELPLLAQYRSEYKRPDTRTQNLRFKHFAFPAEEDHPASSKVVLSFAPESTGLTGNELHNLKLLAGPRFEMDRNEIKISAKHFPTQAQNKHYLGKVYARLVAAAKDAGKELADVPLDPRASLRREAHRFKLYPTQYKWPKEWSRPDQSPKRSEDVLSVLTENATATPAVPAARE